MSSIIETDRDDNGRWKELIMGTRITGAILLLLTIAAAPAEVKANTGTVTEVMSGDLVRFGDFVARLTGITAPTRGTKTGDAIFDFTKREVEGKLVRLFTWTIDNTAAGIVYDEDGRAFVQIFYGKGMSTSLNEILIKKGYAKVDRDRLPADLAHYLDLEKVARDKGIGIWAEGSD